MLELQPAIDDVYRAFAGVPRPRVIEGCPCCIEGKEVDKLLTTPLREICAEDLASYAASAFLTVGSTADYLFLLPRILEVSATEDAWWPDVEVTGRAMRDAQPERWQPAQRDAVQQLFAAVIDDAIEAAAFDKLDEWVCAAGRAGFAVAPLLRRIAESRAAVRGYFDINARSLRKRKLANAFWERPSAAHDEIVAWFESAAIHEML